MDGFRVLRRNQDYIDMLGTAGHSGDETDPEFANRKRPRYNILVVPWHSKELTDYLRSLNVIHLHTRFTAVGQPKLGNWPRDRVESSKVDLKSGPISGLPRNFYDAEWLAGLPEDHV